MELLIAFYATIPAVYVLGRDTKVDGTKITPLVRRLAKRALPV